MKISYINSLCVRYDAISEAVKNEITWLLEQGHDVMLFCYECDFKAIPYKKVEEVSDVAFDIHFQSSDLVVFHFGIFYPLFNLLPVVPYKAKRIVVFHNITPKDVVPAKNRAAIGSSFTQMTNIAFAHHVACDSHINLKVLSEHGINSPTSVLPLAVGSEIRAPYRKPSFTDEVIRLVFIGRFVQAKGPIDTLSALSNFLDSNKRFCVKLDMIGNLSFSDQKLTAEMERKIAALLQRHRNSVEIEIHGNASDELKREILEKADIFILPTYHEGFCVPIVEALSSGCKVISYDNSNVPAVSGGFAELTPTGNIPALAAALTKVIVEVASEPWKKNEHGGYQQYAQQTKAYVETYSIDNTKRRFIGFINSITGHLL